jgi:DNA polymerase-3 subunit delta'
MLVGHKNQWNFLVKAAELGKLPHALLFSGQEQLGKRALAVEFAKFLNCLPVRQAGQSKNNKPCQICRNCRDIGKGIFPDFIFVKPAVPIARGGKRPLSAREIKISQIKELIGKLSLHPYSSFFKIAVLDNAHLMNKEAQNCFLKFLEEPKGRSILILVTEYPDTLLPTIISRVQKIKFFPAKDEEIKNYFLSQKVSKEKADELSSLSFGKPGRALNFYLNPEKMEEEKKIVSDLVKISQSELSFRFHYVKSFSDLSADNLKKILDIWLIHFRSTLLLRLISRKEAGDLSEFDHYSLSKIIKIIKSIQETEFLISLFNINLKLAFENLLIEL